MKKEIQELKNEVARTKLKLLQDQVKAMENAERQAAAQRLSDQSASSPMRQKTEALQDYMLKELMKR